MQQRAVFHTFTDTDYNDNRKLTEARNVLVSEPPDPVDCAIQSEQKEMLYNAIRALPKNEADVVVQRFLSREDDGFRPIAKRLGCSHEHVRKLALNGLRKLQLSLGNLNGYEAPVNCPINKKMLMAVPRIRPWRGVRKPKPKFITEEGRERARQNKRNHYMRNADRLKKKMKDFYRENKNYWKFICQNWVENNRETHAKYNSVYQKVYQKTYRERLGIGYVKGVVAGRSGLSTKDIPQELIELKRQQIKLMRLINVRERE